ncbi:MAG TPA: peroxidase, partial [Blastocatellia bacterium]|nr:peroxidase [Blastocatellia bacterium]
EGGPPRPPDQQPTVPPYLIYLNNDPAAPYMPPKPAGLLVNGSFGAFRILEQDVVGFENLLKEHSNQIDPEELAAKMCGRWRTGTPLALSPDSELPVPPETEINNYDYITYPVGAGDAQGLRCPIGSHMRRNNPRSEDVAGDAHGHRITRRAIPYGPAYDPNKPYDGIERGLVGFFIGAVLWNQFEFLMSTWVNTGNFSINSQPTGKDPVLGSNSADSSVFDIPQPTGNLSITGFPRFVTTKGSAYCFFPGITALKCIGGQLSGAQCQ